MVCLPQLSIFIIEVDSLLHRDPTRVTRPWPSSGPRHGPTDTRGLAIEYSVTGSESWMASSRGKLKTNCSRRVISYELAKPMLKEC